MFTINEDKIKEEKKISGYSIIPYYVDCITCSKYKTDNCVKKFIIITNKLNTRIINTKICKNWELSSILYKIFSKK